MSQYFIPPRQSTVLPSQPVASSSYNPESQLDVEPAVYIFPNPPSDSETQSPYTSSSALSAPTDFGLSSGISTSARSRPRSRRASSNGSGLSWEELNSRARSVSIDTGTGSDLDVEVWEWTGDEEDASDGSGVELEAAVERASRWDLLRRRPLAEFPSEYTENRLQYRRRLRAISLSPSWDGATRSRTLSNQSGASSRPRSPTPHPPLRIPLLSFFSSLLSLDDTTLHLLTRPSLSHSSPLFSGPQLFIGSLEDDVGEDKGRRRDFPTVNLRDAELHNLNHGLGLACDASVTPANPFAFHAIPMLDIWSLVSGVFKNSEKVWNEVLRSGVKVAT